MDYLLIAIVTFIGAGLTLFSGFGLGTLLMPVFAIFFPIDIAIALTAIVHFANNLIKFGFFYKHIDWRIILRFGIPSIFAAFIGAYLLKSLTDLEPIMSYVIFGKTLSITPIKLTIAILLLIFSLFELVPKLSSLHFDKKYMPLGGLLSGFFGGLSGNQGALRTAFLIRAGLTKEVFIGSGVVIACMIDITRLSIYSQSIITHIDYSKIAFLVVAVVSAFVGVYIGNKLIKKITIKTLQVIVAVMLGIFSILLGLGIL
ncbi:MAG: TSUP family transporter [Tenuifilaceae bacterium]